MAASCRPTSSTRPSPADQGLQTKACRIYEAARLGLVPSVWPRSVREIPGGGFQLASVNADIAQGAVVELVDAGELGAIAKISPDGVEQKCSEHGPGFPLSEHGLAEGHCSHWRR